MYVHYILSSFHNTQTCSQITSQQSTSKWLHVTIQTDHYFILKLLQFWGEKNMAHRHETTYLDVKMLRTII
jgi:hypothetical protein